MPIDTWGYSWRLFSVSNPLQPLRAPVILFDDHQFQQSTSLIWIKHTICSSPGYLLSHSPINLAPLSPASAQGEECMPIVAQMYPGNLSTTHLGMVPSSSFTRTVSSCFGANRNRSFSTWKKRSPYPALADLQRS